MEEFLLTLLAVGVSAAVALAFVTRKPRAMAPRWARWALLLHPILYLLPMLYARFSRSLGPDDVNLKVLLFHALLVSAVFGSAATLRVVEYTAWIGALCIAEIALVIPVWFIGLLILGTLR
jgi:hypothetical protein